MRPEKGCGRPAKTEPTAVVEALTNFDNNAPPRSVQDVLTIAVTSVARRAGCFEARLAGDDRVLVASSRTPFLDAARVLLADGCDPTTILVMRHAGSSTDSLRSTVGAAAKLRVSEGERESSRFRSWKPFHSRHGSPSIASNAIEVGNQPPKPENALALAERAS